MYRGCAYARVHAPEGEDVARVADVAGVERLVAPGGRGRARCSSARRTRVVSGSDCGSRASGAGRGPEEDRVSGARGQQPPQDPCISTATALSPLRVSSGSSVPSMAKTSARCVSPPWPFVASASGYTGSCWLPCVIHQVAALAEADVLVDGDVHAAHAMRDSDKRPWPQYARRCVRSI